MARPDPRMQSGNDEFEMCTTDIRAYDKNLNFVRYDATDNSLRVVYSGTTIGLSSVMVLIEQGEI